ncbi:MAG: DUF1801 domain-containing protein [Saprospiraceae bacterium]|nr:DUF1801 domain-containing protein [Saprospiraceae bacterium]MCC6281558.1 DUF1801 domain-containing protein [Saprospiraceae bacterium]
MMQNAPTTIDAYIAEYPKDIQEKLEQMRTTIQQAAPEAIEAMKYAIPTFVLHGNLVHFAAFTHHIGFYATPTANEAFAKDLAPYKMGKGSIQFPIDEPLPLELVKKIVLYRVRQNTEKAALKQKK